MTKTSWCIVEERRGPPAGTLGWDAEAFDALKADFRRTFPRHSDAIYSGEDRAWSLPQSRRRALEGWVSACFEDDAIEWERPQASPVPARVDALAEAHATLCVTPAAPRELVAAARRILSKAVHPDHDGGDELAQRRLNNAYDIIVAARDTASPTEEFVAFYGGHIREQSQQDDHYRQPGQRARDALHAHWHSR